MASSLIRQAGYDESASASATGDPASSPPATPLDYAVVMTAATAARREPTGADGERAAGAPSTRQGRRPRPAPVSHGDHELARSAYSGR